MEVVDEAVLDFGRDVGVGVLDLARVSEDTMLPPASRIASRALRAGLAAVPPPAV
ncbi:MAG: hypothetical protein ACRDSE_18090 [Pseudonocardiaceae bacterium]